MRLFLKMFFFGLILSSSYSYKLKTRSCTGRHPSPESVQSKRPSIDGPFQTVRSGWSGRFSPDAPPQIRFECETLDADTDLETRCNGNDLNRNSNFFLGLKKLKANFNIVRKVFDSKAASEQYRGRIGTRRTLL